MIPFNGNTDDAGPWEELEKYLGRAFTHETGHKLTIQAVSVDTAGHRTSIAYAFVDKMLGRQVFAIIGREGSRPIVSSPSKIKRGPGFRPIALYTVGIDALKKIWSSRLKLAVPGPGYVHLPRAAWCDNEFAEQMTSEAEVRKMVKGVPVKVWKKLRARNEAWDCSVYALHTLRLKRPDLDAELKKLHEQPKPTPPPAASDDDQRGRWIPKRPSGWLRRR